MNTAAWASLRLLGWVVVALMIAFLGGYIAGKRFGRSRGQMEGEAFAPLDLRRMALTSGVCPICGTTSALEPACEEEEEDGN